MARGVGGWGGRLAWPNILRLLAETLYLRGNSVVTNFLFCTTAPNNDAAPALTLRSNNDGAATMMIDEERIFLAHQ